MIRQFAIGALFAAALLAVACSGSGNQSNTQSCTSVDLAVIVIAAVGGLLEFCMPILIRSN